MNTKKLKTTPKPTIQVQQIVMCDQCFDRNLKSSDVKNYRATTPDGEQANVSLCKPCVDYLRQNEHVRLKLIST